MIQKKTDPFVRYGDSYSLDCDENECFGEEWPYSEVGEFFAVPRIAETPEGLNLPPTPATPTRIQEPSLPVNRSELKPKYELCVLEAPQEETTEKKSTSGLYKTIRSLFLAFVVGIFASLLLAQLAADRMMLKIEHSFLTQPQGEVRSEIVANLDGETLAQKLGTHKLDSDLGALLLNEASKRKDERLSKVLAALTDSSDRGTRVAALRALGTPFHLAQAVSIRAILDRMQWDKDILVRGFAAKIIARSESETARNLLKKQLQNERSSLIAAIIIRELDKARPITGD